MIAAAESVVLELSRLQSEIQFNAIFGEVNEVVDVHDLDPVAVPRVRQPPQR
jgi:hypothetical protein